MTKAKLLRLNSPVVTKQRMVVSKIQRSIKNVTDREQYLNLAEHTFSHLSMTDD